jgi:two-component system, cell cycle response regulator
VRVLLVEDNDGDARLLREFLSERHQGGPELARVKSLAEALEFLGRETADVALLDLALPDTSGLDTVRRVRAAAPDLALIVLTGLDDSDVAVRAVRAGAQDYLIKGEIDANVLGRAIRYALERQKMQVALSSLALIDDLTGLYNRRGFLALAEHQLKLARRTTRPFALVFIDIDGLKAINDTMGHIEGNHVITEIGFILKDTFRSSDILGRLGGDEFCVFMIDAGADVAHMMRRRLRERTTARNAQASARIALDFSMGALCCQADDARPLDDLVSAADALMYSEKTLKRSH